jgi:acyl-CoA synthetase (AMP-forming)/AMP-acid ligase II
MIKIRGYRIYPLEIENAVTKIGIVGECCVIPNIENNALVCFITKRKDDDVIDLDEIQKLIEDQVASYMVPELIIIKDYFPRTANGKVDKKKLREEIVDEIISK